MAPMFRFMVIDEDGHRVGRFETADPNWRAGDVFALDEEMWRIAEILPEVSTMVAYNAVWVAAPGPRRLARTGRDPASARLASLSAGLRGRR
jgi:hypothetical protein